VVQYVNFWPCEWNNDKKFMSRAFEFAHANGIGLGWPGHRALQEGADEKRLSILQSVQRQVELVAMAVQEPTLTYTNPETKKPFTREEFVAFAEGYLGVDIIFWAPASPWLKPET
jgi:hypothetical protein